MEGFTFPFEVVDALGAVGRGGVDGHFVGMGADFVSSA